MTVDGTDEALPKQTKLHQCCCVTYGWDRCENRVPMDVPFCYLCEDRHPEMVANGVDVRQEL